VVLGIGMGFGLYESAFATAAGLYGREARSLSASKLISL